ncbi:MAG: hypothetical protein J6Q02_01260 [Lachnospiraceae bacterium]|nr:hypothetical protein [Lachnospiraceae bacterium]
MCTECGEEMSIPGLMDKNVQEIDEQYRAAHISGGYRATIFIVPGGVRWYNEE